MLSCNGNPKSKYVNHQFIDFGQYLFRLQSYTDGKLKVFVYHGSNPKIKGITVKELKSYDVVMISCAYIHPHSFTWGEKEANMFYLDSGLESMHRKEVKGWTRGKGLVKEDSKLLLSKPTHRLVSDQNA